MPQVSTVPEFLEARRTGNTKTTERLNAVFSTAHRGAIANGTALGDLKDWLHTQRAMNEPLPQTAATGTADVRGFLGPSHPSLPSTASEALGSGELEHVDDWPANQKEMVRKKLVEALDAAKPRNVKFKWKLHRGDHEITDIRDPDEDGDITITFKSPWKYVKLHASGTPPNLNEITVNVDVPPADNVILTP
jgi:hypothetical protein